MGEILGEGLCLTLVGDGNLVNVSADVHGVGSPFSLTQID